MVTLIHLGLFLVGGVTLTLPATTRSARHRARPRRRRRVAGADAERSGAGRVALARLRAGAGLHAPARGAGACAEIVAAPPRHRDRARRAPACRVSPATELRRRRGRRGRRARPSSSGAWRRRRCGRAADRRRRPRACRRGPPRRSSQSVLDPTQALAGTFGAGARAGRRRRLPHGLDALERRALGRAPGARAGRRRRHADRRGMLETRRLEVSSAALRPGARILGRGAAGRSRRGARPRRRAAAAPISTSSGRRWSTRGDTIFLDVKKGPINARIGAVAEEDGALGDRIARHAARRRPADEGLGDLARCWSRIDLATARMTMLDHLLRPLALILLAAAAAPAAQAQRAGLDLRPRSRPARPDRRQDRVPHGRPRHGRDRRERRT